MFSLIDGPPALCCDYLKEYRDLSAKSPAGRGHRFWQSLESSHSKELADGLRRGGLKAPVAGGSHWRRGAQVFGAPAAPRLHPIHHPPLLLAPRRGPPPWPAPTLSPPRRPPAPPQQKP